VLTNTVTQDTALGIYFNGNHAHCWVEDGPNTAALLAGALDKWVPDHTLVLVLLNNGGFGGCGGGGRATLPLGVTWDTIVHEFGHALGGFADEYCGSETYSGAEPDRANITKSKAKDSLASFPRTSPRGSAPPSVRELAGLKQVHCAVRRSDAGGGPLALSWRRRAFHSRRRCRVRSPAMPP
jgi:IgA Peptidase M64